MTSDGASVGFAVTTAGGGAAGGVGAATVWDGTTCWKASCRNWKRFKPTRFSALNHKDAAYGRVLMPTLSPRKLRKMSNELLMAETMPEKDVDADGDHD